MSTLDDFDVDEASGNLANVGQHPVGTEPPPFDPTQPIVAPAAAPGVPGEIDVTPQAPVAAPAPASTPVSAPSQTDPVTPEIKAEAAREAGLLPTPPKPTGNPVQDVQNNLEYTRKLSAKQDEQLSDQNKLVASHAAIESSKALREAAEEKRALERRAAEQEEFASRRAAHQTEIDQAVTGRTAAMKDLTNAGKDETFGMKLGRSIAIAVGALGQALQAKGHVQNAQNEGAKAVDEEMARDYQRRKDRLAAASAAVLEARYGFKDAAENHRAALNDIDADTAAKYRLIAKEAEEQQLRQGVPEAIAKNNLFVIESKQKAAAIEQAILQREEEMGVHRETAAATNAMAGAHLGLAERTAVATENQHKETNAEAWARIGLAKQEAKIRDEDRQQALALRAKTAAANATPTTLTDSLTGKDLPIDPTRTDRRKHDTAAAGLPNVNGAIQILDTVLKDSATPSAPEWLSAVGVDTSAQGKLNGMMTRFRSAYAASKKESVGEANAKELADAIPDPPSNIRSKAAFNVWKKKIEDTRAELHDTRRGLLANAGVTPEVMATVGADAPEAKSEPKPKAKVETNKYSALPQTMTVGDKVYRLNPETGKYRP